MFKNRMPGIARDAGNVTPSFSAHLTGPPTIPIQAVQTVNLYQAAFEKAKRDHELDRLFNPSYYEAGGGI